MLTAKHIFLILRLTEAGLPSVLPFDCFSLCSYAEQARLNFCTRSAACRLAGPVMARVAPHCLLYAPRRPLRLCSVVLCWRSVTAAPLRCALNWPSTARFLLRAWTLAAILRALHGSGDQLAAPRGLTVADPAVPVVKPCAAQLAVEPSPAWMLLIHSLRSNVVRLIMELSDSSFVTVCLAVSGDLRLRR